jgi:diguanylate cyclase (GGDEF)-like protein
MEIGLGSGVASVGARSRPTVLERIRGIRSSDYVVVGRNPRFRAVQRRRTRIAARAGFLVIGAAVVFDALVLLDRQPGQAPVLAALNGGVAVLCLAGWLLLRDRFRRYPDPVAAVVTLALVVATAGTGMLAPALAIESAGYLLLIPVLVTLILPWSTPSHVRWLAGYTLISSVFLVNGSGDALSIDERADLMVVALVGIGASLAGHGLLQLAAVRNHVQIRKIETLRRRADADMAELARVHRALEETARTDPLTGARNRLRLVEDLRSVRARMNRLGLTHGIIAFDLDRFKQINDRNGHLAGDEVLRSVVAAVRGTIRTDDEVYRFGGEEFLVVLRVQEASGLAIAGERLRRAIEDLAIRHPDNEPHGVVTVSLGGVYLTGTDLAATDDEWFARADAALYRAKESGRNRYEAA